MQKLKKINALSLGYNLALIYLIFGILFSAFMLILRNNPNLIGVVNPATLSLTNTQIFILYPLGYAIGGFFTGLIIAFVYNHIVKLTGGISIELSSESSNEFQKIRSILRQETLIILRNELKRIAF